MNHLKRLAIFYLTICWTAAIFIILLLPMPWKYYPAGISFYDKAIHFVIFAVFGFLLIYFLNSFERISLKKACLTAFISGFFMVFLGEYLQAFVPGRSPSIYDLISGYLGIMISIVFSLALFHESKKRLLLHVCCATCAIYVSEVLEKQGFRVVLFYHNPNTYPKKEYEKRAKDVKKIAKIRGLELLIDEYDHQKWKKAVRGREKDKEGGERCLICYRKRLEETAKRAKSEGIRYFTSTLSVSPHKQAERINKIGQEIAKKHGVEFLSENFKKKDGFKRSIDLSKKHKFYRQNYCGCEYSLRPHTPHSS
ncbi:hypothetical protein GF382_01585 [Candidatus Falkowbacteria bacterium]|nr:hypothetical protein [Candidatus Falkowbacteria bacterium]